LKQKTFKNNNVTIFTALCHAERGYEIACRLSVCPSVRLSVRV